MCQVLRFGSYLSPAVSPRASGCRWQTGRDWWGHPLKRMYYQGVGGGGDTFMLWCGVMSGPRERKDKGICKEHFELMQLQGHPSQDDGRFEQVTFSKSRNKWHLAYDPHAISMDETLNKPPDKHSSFIFFNFYLFIWQRERSQVGREREREEEACSLLNREPDSGLDPRTLRSWPEPKAEALTHWATQAPQAQLF